MRNKWLELNHCKCILSSLKNVLVNITVKSVTPSPLWPLVKYTDTILKLSSLQVSSSSSACFFYVSDTSVPKLSLCLFNELAQCSVLPVLWSPELDTAPRWLTSVQQRQSLPFLHPSLLQCMAASWSTCPSECPGPLQLLLPVSWLKIPNYSQSNQNRNQGESYRKLFLSLLYFIFV